MSEQETQEGTRVVRWAPRGRAFRGAAWGAVGLALFALPLAAQRATSQREPGLVQNLTLEPHWGLSIPTGRFADLEDPGAAFGVRLAYSIEPRLAIEVEGGVETLEGAELAQTQAPDMNLWRYNAGLEAALLPPAANRWSLMANVGAGAATFRSERFQTALSAERTRFNHTYFSANGGLELGYSLARAVTVFADGEVYWSPVSKGDLQVLTDLDAANVSAFDSAVTWPLSIGLRAHL
jgi:hypothetical protein